MNASRRIGRMTRNKNALPKLPLTSLMDVFTILVFFLLGGLAAWGITESVAVAAFQVLRIRVGGAPGATGGGLLDDGADL